MARPITAFRSPCMTLCASSSPNRPARPARTQKPPRASWDMIAARAPIHGLPFAYGIPHVLPPKPSSQISPHTKRAAHILPSVSARGALPWPDALHEGRSAALTALHHALWRARSRPAIPLHVTPHASFPPNHPTRSVRMQKPPRASRNTIAARAPIHGLPFAYGIPHVLPPPRPSSQISPHTKRAAHILPSECAARCHGRTCSAQRRSAVLHRASSHVMARPITPCS